MLKSFAKAAAFSTTSRMELKHGEHKATKGGVALALTKYLHTMKVLSVLFGLTENRRFLTKKPKVIWFSKLKTETEIET